MFIVLLSFSGSLAAKYIPLKNQPCANRPTLIDLNLDEHNQGLNHYTFMVNLDRYDGSGNSFENSSIRIRVPNKTEDVN